MRSPASLPLTNSTRLYIAADNIHPPYVNRFFFDGTGGIDIPCLQDAIRIASDANPGSRYVLRGILSRSRWIDSGITPLLRVMDGAGWDGRSPADAPACIDAPLDVRKGPACEVIVLEGKPLRLVFRTHHGVMDGRGTLTWIEDIFRALRGEPVTGSDPLVSEDELLNITKGKTERAIPYVYASPTGTAAGGEEGFTWRRITLSGSYSMLLPKVMIVVARQVWRFSRANARFGISVDMRPRREGLRSTNNLTNAFFLDFGPDMTPSALSELIRNRMENRRDGTYTLEDRLIRHTPLRLLEYLMKRETGEHHARGQYRYSAYVSNMGRVQLEDYSGGGFTADSFWAIPPGMGVVPFFLAMCGYGDTIELMGTMPRVLATDGRLDELMECIRQGLEGFRS